MFNQISNSSIKTTIKLIENEGAVKILKHLGGGSNPYKKKNNYNRTTKNSIFFNAYYGNIIQFFTLISVMGI